MSTLKEVARYVLYWVKKKDYKLFYKLKLADNDKLRRISQIIDLVK